MNYYIMMILFLTTSCYQNKEKKDSPVFSDNLMSKLSKNNIVFKHYNLADYAELELDTRRVFYDKMDDRYSKNMQLSNYQKYLLKIDTLQDNENFCYSINEIRDTKNENIFYLLGFHGNGEAGMSYKKFYLFDAKGENVKQSFTLSSGGEFGVIIKEYARFTKDSISTYFFKQIPKDPARELLENHHYTYIKKKWYVKDGFLVNDTIFNRKVYFFSQEATQEAIDKKIYSLGFPIINTSPKDE